MSLDHIFDRETVLKYGLQTRKLQVFDKKVVHGERIFGDGPHSTTRSFTLAYLRCLFDHVEGTFLDLGSGLANVVIYASMHGLESYGIESDEQTYEFGLRNIAVATQKELIPGARIAHGNFFGSFKPQRIVDSDREDHFAQHLLEQQHARTDAYAQLGIQPTDVDLFYHYQVERMQNLLDFFSIEAKVGAKIVVYRVRGDNFRIPENVRLLGSFGRSDRCFMYEKTQEHTLLA